MQSSNENPAGHLKTWLAPALVLFCVLLAFGRTATHDFLLWDDDSLILDNPAVRNGSLVAIGQAWKAPHEHLYVPLTYNIWNFVAHISDRNGELVPAFFHAANLLMHGLCAILVYYLVRLLGAGRFSIVAALLFAVHPIQVEAVAWASAMKDLLSTALALLGIILYVQAAKLPSTRMYVAALLVSALATFAKPGVIGLPVMLLLIDCVILQRIWKTAALRVAPFLLVMLPAILITQSAQPPGLFVPPRIWLRPAIAADAMAFYAWKIIAPTRLCADYGQTPQLVLQSGRAIWTWLIPAALAFVAMLLAKRRPLILVGLGLTAAGLLPVLGLIPFGFQYYSSVADRYMYLPMIGISIAAAGALQGLNHRKVIPVIAAVLLMLGGLCFRQAAFWYDTGTLEQHTVWVNPLSAGAHTRLAWWHAAHKDFRSAERESWLSLASRYDYVLAMNNAVAIQLAQGQTREAIRTAQCMQRIAAIWNIPESQLRFGKAWIEEGRRVLNIPKQPLSPSSPGK